MPEVSIRDLRNQLDREPLTAEELIARRRNLPPIDYRAMRAELDEIIDPSL